MLNSTTTGYLGSAGRLYEPLVLVNVLKSTPLFGALSVTHMPEIGFPFESVTVPVIEDNAFVAYRTMLPVFTEALMTFEPKPLLAA